MRRLKALGLVGEPLAVAFVTSVSVAAAVVAIAAFVHARATAEREAAVELRNVTKLTPARSPIGSSSA